MTEGADERPWRAGASAEVTGWADGARIVVALGPIDQDAADPAELAHLRLPVRAMNPSSWEWR
ncbi:hypothetical protein ACFFRE_11875 [Aciditerrimonas ferrireducens]|uniref:Uncharacterized protein n=1 Tax=Aciditerrimonas ferrireducens TaxID=667306 RepID=A0ABV6C688_9ACTN